MGQTTVTCMLERRRARRRLPARILESEVVLDGTAMTLATESSAVKLLAEERVELSSSAPLQLHAMRQTSAPYSLRLAGLDIAPCSN